MDIKNIKIEGSLKIKTVDPLDETKVLTNKSIEIFKNNATRTNIHNSFWKLIFKDILFGKQFFKNPDKNYPVDNMFIGMGDGTTTSFTGVCLNAPFTVEDGCETSLTYTEGGIPVSITMAQDGTFSGEDIDFATFNVENGNFNFSFLTAPDENTPLLINSYIKRKDSSLNSGFIFSLSSSSDPNIKTEVDFSDIIFNSSILDSLDWFQSESADIYKLSFSETYTGADTDAITGVSIKGKTLKRNAENILEEKETLLMKTNCPFYFTEGLFLSNKTIITVDLEIKVLK